MEKNEYHPDLLKEVEFEPQGRWMTSIINKIAVEPSPGQP